MVARTSSLFALCLALAAPAASAATPESGELSDSALTLAWEGAGPYVLPNPTPQVEVVCEPAVPVTCDRYTLNVNLSDEFRGLEENQRESVRIGITFPTTTGQEDYDLYLYDAAGTLIGESAGAVGVQETITVPLKTLKNGSYTVDVIPYTAFATNYSGAVQVGKDAKAGASPQFGGGFGAGALFGLLALAGLRRARR